MSDRHIGAIVIFAAVAGFIWGLGVGYGIREDEGRIQVASGQYSCALIPNEDKTTKWECKPTKEAR